MQIKENAGRGAGGGGGGGVLPKVLLREALPGDPPPYPCIYYF